jgi:hypothetical protein
MDIRLKMEYCGFMNVNEPLLGSKVTAEKEKLIIGKFVF